MHNAAYWIERLALEPHPEGGYYRQVYKSAEDIAGAALPTRFGAARCETRRPFSTSIYFLLDGTQVSALHRIRSDELWHFYTGSALTITLLEETGVSELHLGPDVERGEAFQRVVPAGVWFGAALNDASSYALVGCTVAPGFHFDDFELAERESLLECYPQHRETILRLTRENG